MIECSLQPIALKYICNTVKQPKYGMYLQAMYWSVKNYGKKNWLVAVNIELNYDEVKREHPNDEEIIKKCIAYLNAPQKSKYGKKRMRKSPYLFSAVPYSYKIVEKNNKKIISAKLITPQQKNKNFWNTGPSVL